jgi:UDP-glucose 4-epimerase
LKNDIGTIVVFGATGTLGTYLVDELAHLGYRVVACARRNISNSNSKGPSIRLASVDTVSKRGFDLLPKSSVRGVVQIAGAMPSRMSGYKPQIYIDVNITGTLNVLEFCRSIQSPVHVYMQSHSDVAGSWNSDKPIPADSPRSIIYKGDHAVYIISKNAAVDLTEHFHQEYGLRTVILRLPTIYCYTPIRQMFVNGEMRSIAYLQMIERAMKSEPIEIWGDANVRKDMVYVKDFNQIVIGAIESASAQGIYNVGTGVGTSLEQQVKGIIEVFSPQENPSPIVYRPDKPSQNGYIYDISKTHKDLGYTPKFPYLTALRDMKMEMQGSRFADLEKADLTI